MLAQIVFPFALGAADPLTGDVAIFRSTGVFEPHVIAHEFCHRKGYLKEVEAQVLAYFALVEAEEPALRQGARCERLQRQLATLAGSDRDKYAAEVEAAGLREDLREAFESRQPDSGPLAEALGSALRKAYDARMRFTGQNGLSDYDEGFTNFLLATA